MEGGGGGGGGGGRMEMVTSPTPSPKVFGMRKKMMMHMTFFWGKDVDVLFAHFPGRRSNVGPYLLSLLLVFLMAFVGELLSFLSRRISSSSGLAQTMLYTVRMGLAYLVMLAVMSFNGGVLLAAVAGHTLGFFLFFGGGARKGVGGSGSATGGSGEHC